MSDIATLSPEALATLRAEKKTAFTAAIAIETPTAEQVQAAVELRDEIVAIDNQIAQAAATATAWADLKDFDPEVTPEAPAEAAMVDPEEKYEDPAEEATETPAEEKAEEDEEKKPAMSAKKVTAAGLAQRTTRPARPEADNQNRLSIVASSNVPGFDSGSDLTSTEDALGRAIINQMRGFTAPQGDGKTSDIRKFGVASIRVPFPEDLSTDVRSDNDTDLLKHAADESRLAGNSLVAAGGWCAPSEIMYDLKADESLDGILSLPEVQVKRGGIRYTVGPQFADFYANPLTVITETQAIAGATKPSYKAVCPTFTEVRLDAIPLFIQVDILTQAAYPELVTRFASGTMIAHQHQLNLNVINRMVALSSAARVIAGLGSTVQDTLEGLELLADERRETYRLSFDRALEVVVPFWVKGSMRADLQRRQGRETPVSDAELNAHFAARKLNVQWVYDWQPIGTTALVYPTTYNALMYPAGTFVKGTSEVINLSATYDAASLATNTYTGLFMEQGLLVAKMQYGSDLVTLPVCNAGRAGAANFTCA